MVKPADTPTRPVNEMLKIFARQTKEDFVINMMTQRIWPYEVYPGYKAVNEKRKQQGSWYSTGKGVKSFDVWVENADPFHMTMVAEYMEYLKYVDIGVGFWGESSDIERGKKANHLLRYNKWPNTAKKQGNMHTGKSSRPAFMMQLRHLQTRMRNYAVDFYGYEGLGKTFGMIDGLEIDLWNGVFNLTNPTTGL
jgi:hypothetical protein